METRWRVHQRSTDTLLSHLCALRGFSDHHLEPDFILGLNDPLLLPGMVQAVEIIKRARDEHWPTLVFGDYDADGTPASALLSLLLKRLGITHQVVLPTRSDGYGLNTEAINKFPKETRLLIAVDTGITAVEEIALAKERGIAVIVLDHHLPKKNLPPADALVDPFLKTSDYPFLGLCGCALAWKLTVALSRIFPNELDENFIKWLLDLVAISTVADMMPLNGENRVLVHYGLIVLRKNRRPGLKALLSTAMLEADTLTSSNLGYSIGPRLNASGRLKDNRPAFELLMETDYQKALPLARLIEAANRERQELVENILAEANKELFIQNNNEDHCFLLLGTNWPPGILGLVAGKLSGKYFRPVIVANANNSKVSGSARSTHSYSIIEALTSQEKLLDRFGGHEQAAGLSLQESNWPEFVTGIKKHAKENLAKEELVAQYTADAILEPAEINLETITTCDRLAPYGLENTQPLFIVNNVALGASRVLGAKGDHLKWSASKEGANFEVIGFGFGKRPNTELRQADLLGYLEANNWQGKISLQFRLVDLVLPNRHIEVIRNG